MTFELIVIQALTITNAVTISCIFVLLRSFKEAVKRFKEDK